MKVVAIIQARMGSTRLPGKVLMDIAGTPMLARVVQRTLQASHIDKVVVATSTLPRDDAIEQMCATNGWDCFRGDERDVLDRYWRTAQAYQADIVVRITSDCPLIDPDLIDILVTTLIETPEVDYASNTLEPRSFPRGLDVEVFRVAALGRAEREGHKHLYREHVTAYIWHHPKIFMLRGHWADTDFSTNRWTVDTPEDLELIRQIYREDPDGKWLWRDVLKFTDSHPELRALNAEVGKKKQ